MDKLEKLKKQRFQIEERIKQFEHDLRKPMSIDSDECALEEEDLDILYGLYQMEKENLNRLDAEIRESGELIVEQSH
ncbi:MAG: hypothetical protein Q7U04_00880 [Bacteriovorax sp.]|nr:hypothetical protein [Bacteriovorax sp.]